MCDIKAIAKDLLFAVDVTEPDEVLIARFMEILDRARLQVAQAHRQIDCPLCGETVKQVASATLSLALSQHVRWACEKGEKQLDALRGQLATAHQEIERLKNDTDANNYTIHVLRTALAEARRKIQSAGAEMIVAERERQVAKEGFTAAHDSDHANSELLDAVDCYLQQGMRVARGGDNSESGYTMGAWPWEWHWWKPNEREAIPNLVKAAALIAAEIDRLSHLKGATTDV